MVKTEGGISGAVSATENILAASKGKICAKNVMLLSWSSKWPFTRQKGAWRKEVCLQSSDPGMVTFLSF